ncbi:MAG: hypothetical protein J6B85_11635 [Lachnospiraceae bacterium]|nr:hypothetical protein [Lachnospiraceae bacterium]
MTTSDNQDSCFLSFDAFRELIQLEVQKRLGCQYETSLISVCKNNSVHFDGLSIRKSGSSLGPNFYLNDSYQEYINGKEIETLIKEVILEYHEFLRTTALPDDSMSFAFEDIKEQIIYCLVGAETNQEILADSPFIPYLDFAIIFQYLAACGPHGISTVRITNEHLGIWDTSVEELFYYARRNTPRLLPFRIMKMSELLQFASASPMQILTNRPGLQGASCILYPNLLKEHAKELNSGFFLLPSSVHEFLILPPSSHPLPASSDELAQEKDALSEIVRAMNATQVKPEDVLTHHAYYYDPITETIG